VQTIDNDKLVIYVVDSNKSWNVHMQAQTSQW